MNPFYFPFGPNIIILTVIVALWSLVWKVYAAYLAARHGHKYWFFFLLILNTLGILELVYIFKVANKSWEEVKKDFGSVFSSNK